MRQERRAVWMTVVVLLGLSLSSDAQNYLKSISESPAQSYNPRIAHFSNGDLLLVDSDLSSSGTGEGGRIFLTRLDNCGQKMWSQIYSRPEYLEFRDVAIGADDDIFVFGSAFAGFAELLFLMKASPNGELDKFNVYQTETVDRFTYSIDITSSKLLINGLLLDFSTQKQGFVGVFDHNLNFEWARRFAPFESTGNAIITSRSEVVGWSGPFIYKLDESGDMVWFKILLSDGQQRASLGGPVEIPQGYAFMTSQGSRGSVFKVADDGSLTWTSQSFSLLSVPSQLEWHQNMLYATYPESTPNATKIVRRSYRAAGQLESTQTLATEPIFFPERIESSTLNTASVINAVAAASAAPFGTSIGDFIIQYDNTAEPANCYDIGDASEALMPALNLALMDVDTPSFGTTLVSLSEVPTLQQDGDGFLIENICDTLASSTPIVFENTITCGQSWAVRLPADFIWMDDASLPIDRVLKSPGIYRGSNRSCTDLRIEEYRLLIDDCDCPIFMPNAFTPDGDATNDVLTIQSSCMLLAAKLKVFDRWGTAIYQSKGNTSSWDGRIHGEIAPAGVYVVQIHYELLDQGGETTSGVQTQDVLLIR